MILFIGTHFRLLRIVMLVTFTAWGPHRDDSGEQHQDDQGNDRVHRKSLRHRATGCAAGALRDVLTKSQRTISGLWESVQICTSSRHGPATPPRSA